MLRCGRCFGCARQADTFRCRAGGGSSDATAVILALDELFRLKLPERELIDCAAALGSDTAFFVRNTPQLCTGRGEVMTPVKLDLRGLWIAVVKPDCGVSTREAYAGIRPGVPAVPLAERIARPVTEWQTFLKTISNPIFCRPSGDCRSQSRASGCRSRLCRHVGFRIGRFRAFR